jgi:GNAT superfamily N-acetyltransferase
VAGRKPIEIAEVDAHAAPDEILARFHAIEVACHKELQPGEPVRGVEDAIAFYRYQPTTRTSCHWLADRGSASLYVHGPTAAFLHLLVAPAKRRRGLGSALLARVLERARQLEVRALRGSYAADAGAASVFLTAGGSRSPSARPPASVPRGPRLSARRRSLMFVLTASS